MDTLSRRTFLRVGAAGFAASLAPFTTARSWAAPDPKDLAAVNAKAHAGLAKLQNEDGSFAPRLAGPGLTALVVAGLIRTGKTPADPIVTKGLAFLEKFVQKDGGIYSQRLANYTTCVAIMAFKEANTDGKYNKVIENANKFLKSLQQGDNTSDQDPKYGGVGYDGRGRPDLSNTHFFVDALLDSGASKDDPALKRALVFVGRCQNLKGEYNQQEWAGKASDADKGGFVYNPSDADNAKSQNRTANGGLRSAGSMTYAGLKSFLYAGVDKNDVRVKGAIDWIRRNYTLAENPGQGQAGLYYYYHLFAKAMDALGEDPFVDAKGVKHDWRKELFDELAKRQKPEGTWVNANGAFQESTPELATAFALLALSYCQTKAK